MPGTQYKNSALLTSDFLSAPVETLFLKAFLRTVPNNYSDLIARLGAQELPASVRNIDQFIHENLSDEISISDLAAASGLNVRVMYKTFQEYKHMSPIAYVKKLRLEKIRDHLQSGNLAGKTITELAMDYNLNHLGRFSADYKKQFGELPSETLKMHSHKMTS